MAGVAGIYFEKHLNESHLAAIAQIVREQMAEHVAAGCEFANGDTEGAFQRTMAALLIALPSYLGKKLEAEETKCPHRGIGMKEAA